MAELPWSSKYAPSSPSEVCVSPNVADAALRFIDGFNPKSKKKGLILYGPTGSGKTSLVYAMASSRGLEVLEINASDTRNKSSMKELLGPAIHQRSLFGGGKIILVDEIEGMSGTKDRGGATELASLVKETSFPVVMTAQNPFDSKFSKLRSVSQMIEIERVPFESISEALRRITGAEGLDADDETITSISRLSNGDIRGAINDLQSSVEGNTVAKGDLENDNYRDLTQSIPEVLRIILKSRDMEVLEGAMWNFDGNLDDVFMWLDYNLPREYKDPKALSDAYDYLSKFDIYNSRIRSRQYWRYLVYMGTYLGCGVGLSKTSSSTAQVRYEQNTRPLKIWMSKRKHARRESIAKKLAHRLHWSASEVIKNFGFYKGMAKNRATLEKLRDELELDEEEVAYLLQ